MSFFGPVFGEIFELLAEGGREVGTMSTALVIVNCVLIGCHFSKGGEKKEQFCQSIFLYNKFHLVHVVLLRSLLIVERGVRFV